MGRKLFEILVIPAFLLYAPAAFADAGYPAETYREVDALTHEGPGGVSPATPCDHEVQGQFADTRIAGKVFSLGRGLGASYYHFIDLSDKSINTAFKEIQREYSDTFQALNIIDIILDDLKIKGKSRYDLDKIRLNFYDALQNQDLSETKLAFVRDMFVVFYENLSKDLTTAYSHKESWLASLGFYTSFQLESLNSNRDEKILISGFDKIMSKRPVIVPQEVYDDLAGIYKLDKPYITDTDLESLKKNLVSVVEYFTNYPDPKPLFNEAKDLVGMWQGVLVNPDNEKYDIRLVVKNDLTATMDIDEIAYDVMVSDIRVVNNYFTFMFKPFGTEKLYLKFNAKLARDIFGGEITDVLGQKGYWALSRSDDPDGLKEETVRKMTSYIQKIEKELEKTRETVVAPKVGGKVTGPEQGPAAVPVNNKAATEDDKITSGKTKDNSKKEPQKKEIIIREEIKPADDAGHAKVKVKHAKEAQTEEEYYTEKKGLIKKLKSFLGKLFSFLKFS